MGVFILAATILLASTSAMAAEPVFDRSAPPDTVPDFDGFRGRHFHEGRIHITGQPTAEALRALPGRGFDVIVNLRTPKEMDDRERVPYDEAALADSLGLAYVHLPQGGSDHPYVPAVVDSFAAALDRHPGRILLHCTVGGRASHLWAAYLVQHLGFTVSEAYERGTAIGISEAPLARYLGRPLTMVPVEDAESR